VASANKICCVRYPAVSSDVGNEPLLVLVQENITEKRQNELDIRNMNQTLEKRVFERTHELEEANSELTVVTRKFAARATGVTQNRKNGRSGLWLPSCHELNTPIGTCVHSSNFLYA
jgi:response regulator RpfG family c-di-GMP phosphodiesterase